MRQADNLLESQPGKSELTIANGVFIGITEGNQNNSINIGILDPTYKRFSAKSFTVERSHLDTYLVSNANNPSSDNSILGRLRILKDKIMYRLRAAGINQGNMAITVKDSPDLCAIGEFIDEHIGHEQSVQVLIEVPKIVPFPLPPDRPLPCGLFESDSIYLKIAIFLASKGYVVLGYMIDEPRTKVLVHHLPNQPELAHLKSFQLRFITQGIAKAYAEILLGSQVPPEQAALIVALIAKNKGAYYYWSSFGVVESSQDVLLFMQTRQPGYGNVISAGEVYKLRFGEETTFDDTENIPLEYAVASKQYGYLVGNDAMKAALLQVCKLWGLRLHCYSLSDSTEDELESAMGIDDDEEDGDIDCFDKGDGKMSLVYPLNNDDKWFLMALQQNTII